MFAGTIGAPLVFVLISGGCWKCVDAETCEEKYARRWNYKGGEIALVDAAKENDYDCVKELMEAGQSPSWPDKDYHTPISAANTIEILKLMMSYEAYPNDKNNPFDPVIIKTSRFNQFDQAQYLVDAGVSTDIVNRYGFKAMHRICCSTKEPWLCRTKEFIPLFTNNDNFNVYYNRDFPSVDEDLNDGTKDITASNRECNTLCAKTNGCKVWTRIKREISGGSKVGECWLRSYRPPGVKCNHCDSGVMSCGEMYDNIEYTTSDDIVAFDSKPSGITETNEDCCALCYGTSNCLSWTRVKENTGNYTRGECWLRSSYSEGHHNPAMASGQVKYDDEA